MEKESSYDAKCQPEIKRFKTASGIPVREIYGPKDIEALDYQRDLGDAGQYPFARGKYRGMFRNRRWIERVEVGFGRPTDSRERVKYLHQIGQSDIEFQTDLPTEMGIDPDHPMAQKETGLEGIPLSSMADFEEAFEGIDILNHTLSIMTTHGSGATSLCQMIGLAEKRKIDPRALRGSVCSSNPLSHDPWGFPCAQPLDLSLKLCLDTIEYCVREKLKIYPCSITGYIMEQTGINAFETMAFVMATGIEIIERALQRGLKIDEFVSKIILHLQVGMDFFENIAKIRALRRMWAKMVKERYGAKDPKVCTPNIVIRTAGDSLYDRQPMNNIIRVAYEVLASVLASVQAIDTCTFDEPLALPAKGASRIALNTQYIAFYETGVVNTADPLGGSYYLEYLTDKLETEANQMLKKIEEMGGLISAFEKGWIEGVLTQAALERHRAIESGEKIIVGVNKFGIPREEEEPIPIELISPEAQQEHVIKVKRLKETRDNEKVRQALARLFEDAPLDKRINVIPAMLEATRVYATIGEIWGTMRRANGYAYDPFEIIEDPFS
jgi:methylmalonyl-CoA mutase N-terminal domain/subunit